MGALLLRSTVWDQNGVCLFELFHDGQMGPVQWDWKYFQDYRGLPLYARTEGRDGWFRWRSVG